MLLLSMLVSIVTEYSFSVSSANPAFIYRLINGNE